MDGNLIAATILFGPGAVALPTIAVLWHRTNKQHEVERAIFAEHCVRTTPGAPTPPPAREPAPVITTPAPVLALVPAPVAEPSAPVIDLTTRKRIA
ncbi:hypothetical protein ACFOSC_13765 [Streptantibioticus rubrisoli]|uniref:Uncharacterized protein n=1 Tax=Streptantibioticus rubrisoli TaxID=1387313 RepID=A0ABT1PCB4_9ACTN|nr:hypothetical protein [Streptantibioticus rubrisoli]MCQ4043010.1 hypothetical protein [Streptantibioticus rubrisoli]